MVRWSLFLIAALLFVTFGTTSALAQAQAETVTNVPNIVKFSGTVQGSAGSQALVGITFALYKDQHGGAPLWLETQNVSLDDKGNFTVSLGANHSGGLPLDFFTAGEARWLGFQVESFPEQDRVMLATVPYAAKAADAETLGGKPLSAFVLATPPATTESLTASTRAAVSQLSFPITIANTTAPAWVPNYIPKFLDTSTLTNANIVDASGKIGIGTTTPETLLDVVGNSSQMVKIGNVPWAFRFGSLQSGTQFIGIGVKKNAANNNYIATSADIATVNHTAMEFNYDGSWRIRQQPHQPDGTILNLVATLALTNTGNFGVGVNTPQQKMEVNGNIKIDGAGNGLMFPDGSIQTTAIAQSGQSAITAGEGMVIAGTPAAPIIGLNTVYTDARYAGTASAKNVFYGDQVFNKTVLVSGQLASGSQTVTGDISASGNVSATTVHAHVGASVAGGIGMSSAADAEDGTALDITENGVSGVTTGIHSTVASAAGYSGIFDNLASGTLLLGRVKIGDYWVRRFRVDGSGRVYANNGYATGGADFAESFAVEGGKEKYEPADVLVIDPTATRRLTRSTQPYSTLVAGVYSTRPGVIASPYEMDDKNLEKEVPLAVVGVVPCKVSAENGPIAIGDLLVTASLPGYAMKGTDRSRMVGAVLGKALQSLDSGTGVIQILVSLQ